MDGQSHLTSDFDICYYKYMHWGFQQNENALSCYGFFGCQADNSQILELFMELDTLKLRYYDFR